MSVDIRPLAASIGSAIGRFLRLAASHASHFCPLPASEAGNVAPLCIGSPDSGRKCADLQLS